MSFFGDVVQNLVGAANRSVDPTYARQLQEQQYNDAQASSRQAVFSKLMGNPAYTDVLTEGMEPIEGKGFLGGKFDREGLFARALANAQTKEGFDLASKGFLNPNKGKGKSNLQTIITGVTGNNKGRQQNILNSDGSLTPVGSTYDVGGGVTVNMSDKEFGLKDRFQGENTLRKGYRAQSKPFDEMDRSFNRINSANANGVGDMSLMFAYMKLLDPASTVREGEIATLQNAGGVPEAIWNMYNNVKGSGKLTDKMRNSIITQSRKFYDSEYAKQKDRYDNVYSTANKYGLDAENITGKMPTYIESEKPEIKRKSVSDMTLEEINTELDGGP